MPARRNSKRPEAPAGLPLQEFSAIVGAIYECALDPTGWPATLDRVRAATGGAAAWIAVHYPNQMRSVYEIEVGTDPERQRQLREHYIAASPFIGVTHHVKLGDVIAVGDVIDYDEFARGRFYQEWSAPQGWRDFILAVIAKEADRFSWLGICMPQRATSEQKALAGAFRPHVERALRISDLLEQGRSEAADLAAAMEALPSGVVLVREDLTLHGHNPASERLMREARGPHPVNGRLAIPASPAGAELRAAIAASARSALDRAGASILFEDRAGGLGLLVHVLPLGRPLGHSSRDAVAALFVTNPAAPIAPTPMQAFVKRFGLTPSETRVLMALMEGKSPGAIAATQGVSMPTIRTHLSRLYDKTGTGSQAGVVRMVAGLGRT